MVMSVPNVKINMRKVDHNFNATGKQAAKV